MAERPTEAQISEFLDSLRAYRKTIPEGQQKMLDVMVTTTLGMKKAAADAAAGDVQAFWAAVNPVGPAGGYGAGGVAVNPVGPAGGYGSGVAVW
jgi:hypothetical protein